MGYLRPSTVGYLIPSTMGCLRPSTMGCLIPSKMGLDYQRLPILDHQRWAILDPQRRAILDPRRWAILGTQRCHFHTSLVACQWSPKTKQGVIHVDQLIIIFAGAKGPLPYKHFLPHPYPPTSILPTPILSAPTLSASHTSVLLASFYSEQPQLCSLMEIFCFCPLSDEPTHLKKFLQEFTFILINCVLMIETGPFCLPKWINI